MPRSRFEAGYREIVYTLIYPGVLASMLYDLYQLVTGGQVYRHWTAMLLVTLLYLLDYFHLYIDLKPLTRFVFAYCSLDLLAATLFGLGFAYAKIDDLVHCRLCVLITVTVFLVYSFFERTEHGQSWRVYIKRRWFYPALVAVGLVCVTWQVGWTLFNAVLVGSAGAYVVYIACVWQMRCRDDRASGREAPQVSETVASGA